MLPLARGRTGCPSRAFLCAWKGRATYRAQSTFRALRYRITTNACLRILERRLTAERRAQGRTALRRAERKLSARSREQGATHPSDGLRVRRDGPSPAACPKCRGAWIRRLQPRLRCAFSRVHVGTCRSECLDQIAL